MTRLVRAPLLVLALTLPAGAQEKENPEALGPAEQYKALVAEYRKARSEYFKAWRATGPALDRQWEFMEKYERPYEFAQRFLDLAEKYPKDPIAVEALAQVFNMATAVKPGSPGLRAREILQRDYLKSDKLSAVSEALVHRPEQAEILLPLILKENQHRAMRGEACLALARASDSRLWLARYLRENPEKVKYYEKLDPYKERMPSALKGDLNQLEEETAARFERVAKDFGDLTHPRLGSYGAYARAMAEAARRQVRVGKGAPEIRGEDMEGKPFTLSDYRGKVVLLDFWGHW
jgi:hypothetical protein